MRRGLSVGLAAVVAVLVAVLVSAPVFVLAAGEGSWAQDRDVTSPTLLGATVSTATNQRQVLDVREPSERIAVLPGLVEEVTAVAGDVGLSEPVVLAQAGDIAGEGPAGSQGVQLLARDGAQGQVRVLAGSASADGVLVPAELAAATGVGPGDVLDLRTRNSVGQTGATAVPVPVAGVYEKPGLPLPSYWEGQGYRFFLELPPDPTDPAQAPRIPDAPLIGTRELVLGLSSRLQTNVTVEWFFPSPAGLGRVQAQATADRIEALGLRLDDPSSAAAELFADAGQPPTVRTSLPTALTGAAQTVRLLAPPVRAVGVGGAAAALLLVGVWAAQRVRRQEVQLQALVARGLSPAEAGRRAVMATVVPVLAGAVVGAGAGVGAVLVVGPVDAVPAGWWPVTWPVVLAAAGAALVVVAVVTAVAVARMGRVGVGAAGQLLGRVPWIPVVGAVAVVAAGPLFTGSAPVEGGTGVGVVTLGVPLLVVAAVTGVVVAGLQKLASRARGVVSGLPVGPFLGVRRVLAASSATRLVAVATAVSLGLVVYAGALASSTARTVQAKAVVAVGSDVVVDLAPYQDVPPLPGGTTQVSTENRLELVPGDVDAALLGIDPATFADVAFWDESFAEEPLADLVDDLVPGAVPGVAQGRVPVLVAGDAPGAVLAADGGQLSLSFGAYQVPAQVVGRTRAFPGMSSTAPTVVAAQGPLDAAITAVDRDPDLVLGQQVWGRGDPAPVLAAFTLDPTAAAASNQVTTAVEFADRPELRAQTWTLGYLRAVAAVAGALGLAGLALYAAAAQRRRTVATVLLDRMGLPRSGARTSAAVELALVAAVSAVLGAGLALPTSWLVLGRLDPVPTLPPDPMFALPVATLVAVVAGVAVLVAVGAVVVDRLTRTASGGQVLRGG